MKNILKRLQKPVSIILVLLSIIWLSFSLWESRESLFTSLSDINPILFMPSVIIAMAELLITSYIYFIMLSTASNTKISARHVMSSYLISQAVHYLPGRIWGHLYLVQATAGQIPVSRTIKANIWHFLLISVYSLAVSAVVLAYYLYGLGSSILILVATQVIIFLALRGLLGSFRNSRNGTCLTIIALLILDWIIYFFACDFILPGHLDMKGVVVIATCYAIALVIGTFAVMSPGGLFVREASFLGLTSLFGYDPAIMFAFSISARVVFTIAEMICASFGMGLALKMNMIVLERNGK